MIRFSPLFLLPLVACTGDKETVEETPEAHACEVVTEAGSAITAGADRASGPSISVGEEPYTVTLVDGAAGFVSVDVAEDTPALLFVGTADVVTSVWHDDMEETLPTPGPNDLCPDDIPEHFDLDLHPGTWNIGVGPAGVDDVWLLLISAEGHAHEE